MSHPLITSRILSHEIKIGRLTALAGVLGARGGRCLIRLQFLSLGCGLLCLFLLFLEVLLAHLNLLACNSRSGRLRSLHRCHLLALLLAKDER